MESKNLVLIVDDEEEIRLLLKDLLEKNGIHVMLAGDGRQALDMVREWRPDLVITDLLLPKEHGLEVMQAIKDQFLLPIIVISGIYKKSEIENRIGDIYIEGFFEKPIDLQGLLACVRQILNE